MISALKVKVIQLHGQPPLLVLNVIIQFWHGSGNYIFFWQELDHKLTIKMISWSILMMPNLTLLNRLDFMRNIGVEMQLKTLDIKPLYPL